MFYKSKFNSTVMKKNNSLLKTQTPCNDLNTQHVRVSKLMSQQGLCSRREADALISKGLVSINGKTVTLGERASQNAKISIHNQGQKILNQKYTILLNKPMGFVSHKAEGTKYPLAVSLITADRLSRNEKKLSNFFIRSLVQGLAPAGRLDIDSQGLLILTQNGVLAKTVIEEFSSIEKEYLVNISGKLNDEGFDYLKNRKIILDGKQLRSAFVEWSKPNQQLRFVLNEGRHRQIRRMCEFVGLKVNKLQRVRIGKLTLQGLKEGEWRLMSSDENV